ALCLCAATPPAKAETATFDDLEIQENEFALPSLETYRGLRWNGIEVINLAHNIFTRFPNSGYRNGRVSGSHVAVVANRYGRPAEVVSRDGAAFDFQSLYLTAGWRDGLTVHVEGLRSGEVLYSRAVVVDTTQPTQFTFGFRGIDTLRISSSGGDDAGICASGGCRPGPEVVLDDFSFALPAEPASAEPPAAPLTAPESPPAEVETPEPEEPAKSQCGPGSHCVQVGAFRSLKNATSIRDNMSSNYGTAEILVREGEDPAVYRVVVGCSDRAKSAKDLLAKLRASGLQGYVVQVSEAAAKAQQ
ncbi:MAG: SPOR domain-containing protein, partial [bacterium]|nr:SPOR domain-containing protein [bacterium]